MHSSAYYNEIDPFAAQWLRNLIAAGHIAPGVVDERSIEDVTPDDLRGFTQHHFFAGIGAWSYSLRLAGWPDNKPVWTGSCPCQPFSAAGKGRGFADERHLWPAFYHLISECRPQRVFGEQVAAGHANVWFDTVQIDMEAVDYTIGIVPFTSAGVGAPHIRERAYWVANTSSKHESTAGDEAGPATRLRGGPVNGMAHTHSYEQRQGTDAGTSAIDVPGGRYKNSTEGSGFCCDMRALEVNGFWRDADWLFCRDGRWRPVEPGTFPLVDGVATRMGRVQPGVARMARRNRVGRLRGYGNAINAQAAAQFIKCYMELSNSAGD